MGHFAAIIHLPATPFAEDVSLLRQAVTQWRDEDAERYASENAAPAWRVPMVAPQSLQGAINIQSGFLGDYSPVIPVCSAEDTVERVERVSVDVSVDLLRRVRAAQERGWAMPWRLREAVALACGTAPSTVTLVSVPTLTAPKAHATTGKTRTVYHLIDQGKRIVSTHDTQAEARAAGVEKMKNDSAVARLAVRAAVIRDSGDADLVIIERPGPDTARIIVDAVLHAPAPGALADEYVVLFDYHV